MTTDEERDLEQNIDRRDKFKSQLTFEGIADHYREMSNLYIMWKEYQRARERKKSVEDTRCLIAFSRNKQRNHSCVSPSLPVLHSSHTCWSMSTTSCADESLVERDEVLYPTTDMIDDDEPLYRNLNSMQTQLQCQDEQRILVRSRLLFYGVSKSAIGLSLCLFNQRVKHENRFELESMPFDILKGSSDEHSSFIHSSLRFELLIQLRPSIERFVSQSNHLPSSKTHWSKPMATSSI